MLEGTKSVRGGWSLQRERWSCAGWWVSRTQGRSRIPCTKGWMSLGQQGRRVTQWTGGEEEGCTNGGAWGCVHLGAGDWGSHVWCLLLLCEFGGQVIYSEWAGRQREEDLSRVDSDKPEKSPRRKHGVASNRSVTLLSCVHLPFLISQEI